MCGGHSEAQTQPGMAGASSASQDISLQGLQPGRAGLCHGPKSGPKLGCFLVQVLSTKPQLPTYHQLLLPASLAFVSAC